jgi:hypothetical protein
MKRPQRHSDGRYHIKGKTFKKLRGSRREVWNGTSFRTQGLLTRDELMQPKKNGRIVSRKKHEQAKTNNNLVKSGWKLAEKGKFGAQRADSSTRKKRGKKGKKGKKSRGRR